MTDFLNQITATDDERQKLRALGAATPMALLSMRKASPEAFDCHLGANRAEAISRELAGLLTSLELEQLQRPISLPGRLGARLPDDK